MSVTQTNSNQAHYRVQALADISRSALYLLAVYKLASVYVVTATKPVHRLQIRPIVHN